MKYLLLLFPLAVVANAAPILEDTVEQTYQVEPTATLSIRNKDGAIRVYGWDGNEVHVQAIKRAYDADRLKNIAINIDAQPGHVSIDTKYPPMPKWSFSDRSGTVDYTIIAPWTCAISQLDLANGEVLVEGMRGKSVRANLANGRFFSHNCFTDFECSVANGGLDISFDWWEPRRFAVNASIANGNARAFLPFDAAFRLLATSVNGHVASDFTEKEQRQQGGVRKIDMVVGSAPQVEVKLSAVNGSVKVSEANP
jgi:hypothetical protein